MAELVLRFVSIPHENGAKHIKYGMSPDAVTEMSLSSVIILDYKVHKGVPIYRKLKNFK